jgi:hypothetical protein
MARRFNPVSVIFLATAKRSPTQSLPGAPGPIAVGLECPRLTKSVRVCPEASCGLLWVPLGSQERPRVPLDQLRLVWVPCGQM